MVSLFEQATQIGGWGFWTGLGSTLRAGIAKYLPAKPGYGSITIILATCSTASSHIARRSAGFTPNPSSSARDADSPVPQSTRPPETKSRVATRSATRAGALYPGGIKTCHVRGGCAANAGTRRQGTPPEPKNASIPRESGAPPPRHSRCPGGPPARPDPARPGRGGTRRLAPRDAAADAHRRSRISWSLFHQQRPTWAAPQRDCAIMRVAAPPLTKAAHRLGRCHISYGVPTRVTF